jgi:hypothetical protein
VFGCRQEKGKEKEKKERVKRYKGVGLHAMRPTVSQTRGPPPR